ncbi:WPP domain-interacting protein 2 [Zea mays]|uniref:WPP domain-interacting protein 2 n=1 Tax=Zea mays TaxID=4577 RepID=A0A1D6ES02_MAIZE|nr:WPP domain-interacting protein 2 [Zea mays]
MDSGANSIGESVGESPSLALAPEPQTRPAEPVTKGRGLRRWRRIPREQHQEGSPGSPGADTGVGASAGEDLAAQLHKRRYGPAADEPKGKQDPAAAEEVESSVASVESSFVPLEASPPPAPTRLDPNLGHLIATAGFSVGAGGADSDNSDDRTSKLSTAASAPRHDFSSVGFGRERDRARSRAPGAAHGKGIRAAQIQKFVEIRKETDEDSTAHQSEIEWSSSPVEELNEKIKMLELKLEEATMLINERDSEILELDALSHVQPQNTVACNNYPLSLQSDVDRLFLEKMEAEIQCFILTRASQDWKLLTMDQFALNEAQKSLLSDHKSLETKLRHAENRAMMLEEMVDKLESQCKALSETSEVLKLQAGASRASLFCSIQFVLLCIAIGTLLVRFLSSSPEIVPT